MWPGKVTSSLNGKNLNILKRLTDTFACKPLRAKAGAELLVIIISYHEDALGKEAGGRGWGLPRAFQLLEYQYGEGRFDKQTSSFPLFCQVYN